MIVELKIRGVKGSQDLGRTLCAAELRGVVVRAAPAPINHNLSLGALQV